jgi:predicted TIM-barrel fold metal-dependent hydrolase
MKTYYDVHCHIFNKDVIIRKLVNVVQSLLTLKNLIEGNLSVGELKYKIEEINKILIEVTQESSEDVYHALNHVYDGKVVTTPLMFDLTYADDNDDDENHNKRYRRRIKSVFWLLRAVVLPVLAQLAKQKYDNKELAKSIKQIQQKVKIFHKNFKVKSDEEVEIFDNANYKQQIADLEFLSKKYDHIKPFFCIDPRREYKGLENALEKLSEKVHSKEGPFYGVKLYAPAGFSPTDPVLMGTENQKGVYAYCEENKIPITVHNSNAGFACFSTVLNVNGDVYLNGNIVKLKDKLRFDNRFFSRHISEAISERARKLNHPKLWELVLQKHPKLFINFAHFGGSGQIMEYVNYSIKFQKIDEDIFEDAIVPLTPDEREVVCSAYELKKGHMYLRENLTINERAKVWNALYRTGFIDNWTKAIFDLVKNPAYPNAFTDLSCFSEGTLIELPETQKLTFSIKEELITFKTQFYNKLTAYEKSKILYGSDYYLTQFFGPNMQQYYNDFRTAFGDDFDSIAQINPERFLNF